MAVYRTGISNSTRGVTSVSSSPNLQDQISSLKSQIVAARVTDIVLNDLHPQFNVVGQWNGIGAIFYELVNAVGKSSGNNFALPYEAQVKTYPVVNEIVLLIQLPSNQQGQLSSNSAYFYMSPLALWNHPHHDAYPNTITSGANKKQNEDYISNGEGNVRRVEDGSTEINLNYRNYPNPSQDNFVEKADIHPLLPFTGDSLLEGRFGQSLRFGHTTLNQSSTVQNNWSSIGQNTDPITILKNGQPQNVSDKGWIPITENISSDLSSIYLTSYQQIPFSLANENFISYTTPPTTPSQYTKPQIILNSDRIVINAKKDSVLISGQNSIGILSNGSVNVDASSHYISSNDIKLGSKNATQPVLLGDNTVDLLIELTEAIKNLASILQVQRDYPGGVLATSYNSVAGNILNQINDPTNGILAQLNNNSLKSQTTKVQ
jgi:hypothetical protein